MNFLAHSYLTFSEEQIVGQFLEDFIKNRERYSYPIGMQEGITLHRAIDTFTDAHPAVHQAKKIFSPLVRLYAGAFVDVSFDYFLANSISLETLEVHVEKVYKVLEKNANHLPPGLVKMLENMKKDNWLYHYRDDQGIMYSMKNVLNKAKFLDKDVPVFEVFLEKKPDLQMYFNQFFPDLLEYVQSVNDNFSRKN